MTRKFTIPVMLAEADFVESQVVVIIGIVAEKRKIIIIRSLRSAIRWFPHIRRVYRQTGPLSTAYSSDQ